MHFLDELFLNGLKVTYEYLKNNDHTLNGLGIRSTPPLFDSINVEKTHNEVIRAHTKFGSK